MGHDPTARLLTGQPSQRTVLVRGTHAALCILLLALVAPAKADPADLLAPPSNLQGTYDDLTAQLLPTWDAPGEGSYTYHVYRDHKEIAQTGDLNFTDASPIDPITGLPDLVYTVRATPEGMSAQSAPSEPFVLHRNVDSTAFDSTINQVFLMLGGGLNIYTELELFGHEREWCDPVNIGVQPNVDMDCISRMLQP